MFIAVDAFADRTDDGGPSRVCPVLRCCHRDPLRPTCALAFGLDSKFIETRARPLGLPRYQPFFQGSAWGAGTSFKRLSIILQTQRGTE